MKSGQRVIASGTARNTCWLLCGYTGRVLLQGLSFVLLARAVGPAQLGLFGAALALANFLSPYIELGAYSLIVRDVAAGMSPARALGSTLAASAISLPLGAVAVISLKILLLPSVPWGVALPTAAAALVGTRLITIAGGMGVATNQMWRNALTESLSGLLQVLGILLLIVLDRVDIVVWAWIYCLQAVLVGGGALVWAARTWGAPEVSWTGARERITSGIHFAFANSAASANELDKTILLRLSTAQVTGIYTAGYRIALLATLPVGAFMAAVYPRYFAAQQNDRAAPMRLARRTAARAFALGLPIVAIVWIAAALVPRIVGGEFSQSVAAVRALSFILLIQALFVPVADALTASGHQAVRTAAQIGGQLVGFALYFVLIPRYGWPGAAAGTLAGQALVALGVYSAAAVIERRNRRAAAMPVALRERAELGAVRR